MKNPSETMVPVESVTSVIRLVIVCVFTRSHKVDRNEEHQKEESRI